MPNQQHIESKLPKYYDLLTKIIAFINETYDVKILSADETLISRMIEKELTTFAHQIRAEERERFKNEVVKYALDQLEHDCLTGPGLHEQTNTAIQRLRYWILEKEVKPREESLNEKG